ncbi:MAG: acyl-CoA thioesterase [Candidatus Lokiarchaeota archaeon]|jgi:acyl-CoA thioester hydrolase|nr:acyl-CoA thioesterase [Candidatus Lokiarchaeota archaeon]MBD3200564.1 acyl-CoA thioesterase [Candidatus Lokiarchaeota archaeon]
MRDFIKDFPVMIQIPVLWGHMDSFQHVNNIIFFRYYESARIAYFEEIGFLKNMEENGIGPILASTSCKYIAPLQFPDTVSVGAKVINIEHDRFQMRYSIYSHKTKKIVATGEALVVSYDYQNNQKSPLPDQIVQNIKYIENLDEK